MSKDKLWVLVGVKLETMYEEYHEENLALFTSKEKAEAYVNSCKLKSPKWKRKFKSKSFLSYYDDLYIEEYYLEVLDIDPDPIQ